MPQASIFASAPSCEFHDRMHRETRTIRSPPYLLGHSDATAKWQTDSGAVITIHAVEGRIDRVGGRTPSGHEITNASTGEV
jgi:hypothetical protein